MDELKPCPFCGQKPELTTYFIKGSANHTNVYASCSCGHKTRSRKGVDGAIDDWNKRPIEDALRKHANIARLLIESQRIYIDGQNKYIEEIDKEIDTIKDTLLARAEYAETDAVCLRHENEWLKSMVERLVEAGDALMEQFDCWCETEQSAVWQEITFECKAAL